MKQLLIISGKGGTGKTSVAGAFIALSRAEAYADVDVDAPNLHLTNALSVDPEVDAYWGHEIARIDQEKCTSCDLCYQHCRYGAISQGDAYTVNPYACEGCAVCAWVCPADAIALDPTQAGELTLYQTPEQTFSTAQLRMGSGNSGKLVTQVKKRLLDHAPKSPLAIIDGSPGIGCPVIASLSGVDVALLVTEPSLSALSDLERVVKTARGFSVPVLLCINKWDVHEEITDTIEEYAKRMNIPIMGRIPFDYKAIDAVNAGKSLVDVEGEAADAVRNVYQSVMEWVHHSLKLEHKEV